MKTLFLPYEMTRFIYNTLSIGISGELITDCTSLSSFGENFNYWAGVRNYDDTRLYLEREIQAEKYLPITYTILSIGYWK